MYPPKSNPTNLISKITTRLDGYQRKHEAAAFLYAVIKKYGDDEAGYKAALITYYTFLALFPLLLVLASIASLLAQGGIEGGGQLVRAATTYIPAIGHDLEQNVHGLRQTGIALVIGIILTLFGARGVADAFRNTLDHIWYVPYAQRARLPVSLAKSLCIILVGGSGLALAPLVSGYALVFGHNTVFLLISALLTPFILFWVLAAVIKIGSSVRRTLGEIWIGALVATVGFGILQSLGGYLMAVELRHLGTLYGVFAIVLGLLFWIYLQVLVLLYALELDSILAYRLWPRSLNKPLTEADHRAYNLYMERARFHDDEQPASNALSK